MESGIRQVRGMRVRMRPLRPFTWLVGADPRFGGPLWQSQAPFCFLGHTGPRGLCESRFGLVFLPGNMRFREQLEYHLLWF